MYKSRSCVTRELIRVYGTQVSLRVSNVDEEKKMRMYELSEKILKLHNTKIVAASTPVTWLLKKTR